MRLFDRWPPLRSAFAAVYLAIQALLIVTAGGRVSHSFGFRMFEESASIEVHVERVLDGNVHKPLADEWLAHDCSGAPHVLRWKDLVRFPAPRWLDTGIAQPYGVDTGVAIARAAIGFVATHTPDDCETRAFVATIKRVRNGLTLPPLTFETRR